MDCSEFFGIDIEEIRKDSIPAVRFDKELLISDGKGTVSIQHYPDERYVDRIVYKAYILVGRVDDSDDYLSEFANGGIQFLQAISLMSFPELDGKTEEMYGDHRLDAATLEDENGEVYITSWLVMKEEPEMGTLESTTDKVDYLMRSLYVFCINALEVYQQAANGYMNLTLPNGRIYEDVIEPPENLAGKELELKLPESIRKDFM